MWISKKKFNALEKRIADLEDQQTVFTFSYGDVDLKKLAQIVEREIKTFRRGKP